LRFGWIRKEIQKICLLFIFSLFRDLEPRCEFALYLETS
jgi:hypothetical protein